MWRFMEVSFFPLAKQQFEPIGGEFIVRFNGL